MTSPHRHSDVADARRKSTFRPEIQGLRSLAVLMVVSYHVWFGRVSGGVDVFLLISAFLMTLQFVARYEQRVPVSLLKHWLHLFRRLLPAAVTVIMATLVASFLVLPSIRWLDVIGEGWASLLYAQNWLLQSEAVDYYATDHSLASPLQHFWSLSIQGQVFILWPLIFVLTAWVAKRYRLHYRPLLVYVFGAIFVVSLGYSIYFTASNQAQAYFDTWARLWEFALGTIVALILPGLRLPQKMRIVLGWLGIIAMLTCGILLNVQAAFPGVAALWPTLSAACVIAAGQTGSTLGVDRILSSKLLVKLGDNSYALYLWHWPILVIGLAWSGKEHAGWISGTVIIATSMILAFLTTRFLEKPWREWKWPEVNRRRSALAILLCTVVCATPLVGWRFGIESEARALAAYSEKDNPGALAMMPGFVYAGSPDAPLVPSLTSLPEEWPKGLDDCQALPGNTAEVVRTECDNGPGNNPDHTVVVIGSSHAFVLSTPFLEMAKKYNWRIITITGGFCPLTTGGDATLPPGCADFMQEEIGKIIAMKPDAVVTTSTRAGYSDTVPEYMDPGWPETVSRLTAAGLPVFAIRDTPRFDRRGGVLGPDCIAASPDKATECSAPRAQNFDPIDPTLAIRDKVPGVRFADYTNYFCNQTVCPAVIGNIVVYKDGNHLTQTYAKTLTPMIEKDFLAFTGWNRP
jgi:peptidoglycan/LPS O-acetylase OafA/YrhL